MQMKKSLRLDWTRDELILALDLYFRVRPKTPSTTMAKVQAVSALTRKIPRHCETKGFVQRTNDSVVMKLMNFRSLDPSYTGTGLSSVSNADTEVWNEFSGATSRLRELSLAIEQLLEDEAPVAGLGHELQEAREGAVLSSQHLKRERNQRLVKRKKDLALAKFGYLACEVCGIDFKKTFGSHGEGFIECHHTLPFHEYRFGQKTSIFDLVLLCSNCHRMIHRNKRWLSVNELKQIRS